MAKNNLIKKYWWLILIGLFLVSTSYSPESQSLKKTGSAGFGCSGDTSQGEIEPTFLEDYDLELLKSITTNNDIMCGLVNSSFYDDKFLQCGSPYTPYEEKIIIISNMYLWSEKQYSKCSDFFNEDSKPHSYSILGEVPCYMDKVEGTNYILYMDNELNHNTGICEPAKLSAPYYTVPYYTCSENDLFVITSSHVEVLTDYHNIYTSGGKKESKPIIGVDINTYDGMKKIDFNR